MLILMYHRLSDDLPAPREEWVYTVEPGRFIDQMDLLVEAKAAVADLRAFVEGRCPQRSVLITFDDGWDTDAAVALPVLRDRNLRASFFLNPSLLDRPGHLSWDEVGTLLGAGMDVGSHGLDHTLLDDLSDAEIERQIRGSKDVLEARLGRSIDALSLPGGTGGLRAARIAFAAGYRIVLGSRPGLVRGAPGDRIVPRYALRRGEGRQHFRALVEQRRPALLRQALRYLTTLLLRRALGHAGYERLRGRLFARWFAPHVGQGQRRPL